MDESVDQKIAAQLKILRTDQQWSLAQLSDKSGISRASLSRLENAEVSATAAVLGKLCAVYKITMSRLMSLVETEFTAQIYSKDIDVWKDLETGFTRKMISPPAAMLCAEMIECHLPKNQQISYSSSPQQGLEHHLYMLDGELKLVVDGNVSQLNKGDCLRYKLCGASQFKTNSQQSATYILTII